MRNSLTLWLTGIIVLTIIGFLVVFKPITFSPRKDPSDADRYLRPVSVMDFDARKAPDATFPVFGKDVYVYVPQHDLRLGLDLRGGMHVVLEIPDRSTLLYTLKEKLDTDESGKKQTELSVVLADPAYLGAGAEDASLTVDEDRVEVIISWDSVAQAHNRFEAVNGAMAKVFGEGKFTAPDADDLFDEQVLEAQREEIQDNIRGIMEKRLNTSGMTEVTAYAKGRDQVVLEIPGVKDPKRVRELIKTTAELEFRLVPADMQVIVDEKTGEASAFRGSQTLDGTDAVIKATTLVVSGKNLKPNCDIESDPKAPGMFAVSFELRDHTKEEKRIREKFTGMTSVNKGRQLMIVLDNKVIMAPVIQDTLPGKGIITGGFDMEEAKDLKTLLNAGALPVPVQIAETRTVSPTLGADSIAKSLVAGIIGLAAVLIFMAAYYRLPGMMANIALIIYLILSLAVLKAFDATLTLPGIAGVIIAIGMAVDANVIIFERLKEELRTKKPLETAIDVAFNRAWTAILDSNVASLITGAVLYSMGSGAVKGFAITLLIGVAVSMFTAVTVTRLLMKLMIRSRAGHNMAWYGV
jgi:preprotein translocase subunit SecD